MADCAMCSRSLGGSRRRCRVCGSCESCCRCEHDYPELARAASLDDDGQQWNDVGFVPFSPAELGLDPEDYDLELWERGPRRR